MEPLPASLPDQRYQMLVDAVIDYGIFLLNVDGLITTWNSGAERLKGYTKDDVVGRHFSLFYEPDAIARGWPDEELRLAAERGRFEDEGWRLRKDGSRFWANVVITALRTPAGVLTGFAKITRDLTERQQQVEQLRTSEERFRLMVESVRDYGIFMLDTEGFVRGWNAGAQALKGYTATEIIGRHFSTFYTPEDKAAGKPTKELTIAEAQGRVEDEGWRVRKDKTLFWANVVISAVRNDAGQLIGFAKVTRDMTERRHLEDLERSGNRMSVFLAMLAHELRNPLAPIQHAVSVMQLEPQLSPILQRSRDVIGRQLTHMTRLVDDLLDIGRLSTGKIVLRKEPVDLADVVARGVEIATPLIDARRHRLNVHLPDTPVHVFGDLIRLTQVLQNLLTNAAKYTPNGGQIDLTLRMEDGFAIVEVRDSGRGMRAEDIEAMFELFGQGDNGMPSDSGLGIGLTLARSLMEMHGGSLGASSPGPSRGSTFQLRLPAAPAPAGASEKTVTAVGGDPLRILVIDDNRDAADTCAELLGLLGHSTRAAYGGKEGVELARVFRPQLVFMDIAMPVMDGFETIKLLRSQADLRKTYVAAMTGFGGQDDRDRMVAAGFDSHVTKPAEVEKLVEIIDQARLQD